jgi:Trk-type K+ transport system membrane component
VLWRALADAVVVAHFGFLAYVVLGGFVAWRWPRTIVLHVLAAAWGLLIVTVAVPCPLTALQNQLRERGGEAALHQGFIGTYVTGTLYPAGDQRLVQALVGVVVLTSWVGLVIRRRGGIRRPGVPSASR